MTECFGGVDPDLIFMSIAWISTLAVIFIGMIALDRWTS